MPAYEVAAGSFAAGATAPGSCHRVVSQAGSIVPAIWTELVKIL